MMILETVCLMAALSSNGPGAAEGVPPVRLLAMQQDAPQDAPAPAPQEEAQEEAEGLPFIDVDRIELDLVAGVAVFSSDFEADPALLAGLSFRAPMPWLSRDILGLPEDDLGLFASLRFTSVERDTEPPVEDDSGIVVLADIGLDYTFYRDEDFRFTAQAGLQYGYFGGVTDLENGVAALVGLSGAVKVDEGIWITAAPQVSFGDAGDFLFLAQAGLLIQF